MDHFQKLKEICGHVQNSSEQVVIISQDDATRSFHITVKGYGIGSDASKRTYFGSCLEEAIDKAYAGETSDNFK
jgi:hypothetical protein